MTILTLEQRITELEKKRDEFFGYNCALYVNEFMVSTEFKLISERVNKYFDTEIQNVTDKWNSYYNSDGTLKNNTNV